jgi:nucleoside 2-deoxyribosyltransferase
MQEQDFNNLIMKKAYLAISFVDREAYKSLLVDLKTALLKSNINLLVFVEKYHFKANEEQEMMRTAFKEIDSCDFLIAELSNKSIGAGIEMGYAYSKQIPIIYIHHKEVKVSSTALGIAKHHIVYSEGKDLSARLLEVLV